MEIPLYLHLMIHFSLAVLVGFLIGQLCHWRWGGLVGGILGGFLIDLDHVLEYFLVLGWRFNFNDFIDGRQFLISDRVHLYFHAWEYIPLLLLTVYILRKKRALIIILLALTFSGFVHLISDCFINNYPLRNYSIIYRWRSQFAVEHILNADQYSNYKITKEELGL